MLGWQRRVGNESLLFVENPMSLEKLTTTLTHDVAQLREEGRAKAPERVIVDYVAPAGERGPRFKLSGSDQEFIRMNSNSYLSLSHHPDVLEAADRASRVFGAGPGAVRFIDGTAAPHTDLEARIARFVERPAARVFNSAYTSVLGLSIAITDPGTFWIGDALNHNCIIRAMRISNVPRERRSIFKHNDVADLERRLEEVPEGVDRVIVIFDGIFSMRGDCAPLAEIVAVVAKHDDRFRDGVTTVMDDSHGIGAYGATGRGTEEHCGARADILVGTFGKAFGVNGGFVAGSTGLIEAMRQRADTYIYTNPLGAADGAAAVESVELADGPEGRQRLASLSQRTAQFRKGLADLGLESIPGPHPVVPLLVRDTERTHTIVQGLFERGVLAVGLTFPVVPRGDETIRFQINAAHTTADIDHVLGALEALK
jgi:glycine C-acetyltransferase